MEHNRTALIEAWFRENDDDGEFKRHGPAVPYSVIELQSDTGWVVITTKPTIVSTVIEASETTVEFGMVGRYGLPSERDIRWIRAFIGSHQAAFLGDLDPVDLMVFSWLREHLLPGHIAYLGLGDALLGELAIPIDDTLSIPCTSSELNALRIANEACPDSRKFVGPRCSCLLESGRKLELEVLMIAKRTAASALRSAFLQMHDR